MAAFDVAGGCPGLLSQDLHGCVGALPADGVGFIFLWLQSFPGSAVPTWTRVSRATGDALEYSLLQVLCVLGVSALSCGRPKRCGDGASVCWVREELLLLWMEIQVLVSSTGLAFPSSTAGPGSAWELLC